MNFVRGLIINAQGLSLGPTYRIMHVASVAIPSEKASLTTRCELGTPVCTLNTFKPASFGLRGLEKGGLFPFQFSLLNHRVIRRQPYLSCS